MTRPFKQRRLRGPMLVVALIASVALHTAFLLPFLVPLHLFAAKAPPPEAIPIEIVSLPPKPAPSEEPKPAAPPPEQQKPPEPPPAAPPPKAVELPPPTPPPPVTPQQIVVATRSEATPPQGDSQSNAAQQKPEPQQKPVPPPPPKPQAKPAPPKPEPKPEPKSEPQDDVPGAIALAKPAAKSREQITDADYRVPPLVVRPRPPGRFGNSLLPSYPSAAHANGLEGRVVLLAVIAPDGRPRRIEIVRSSGSDQLDESAIRAVWLWRFYWRGPGPPGEETVEIPLDFKL